MNLLQGRNGDTDVENRLADTAEEGESGMNGESNTETYTPPYAKQLASGKFLYNTGSSMGCSATT